MAKTLNEFLNTLPPDVRQKVTQGNAPAAAHNANALVELIDTTLDAILNVATIAASGGAQDDTDREFIARGLALASTTTIIARAIMIQFLPPGPREQVHMIMLEGVAKELPKIEEKLRSILQDSVEHRKAAKADVLNATPEQLQETMPVLSEAAALMKKLDEEATNG